ncbi:type II toxin-antitoxin system RelE/ParE family toxin [Gloeocapsa sp. PCC 73106]|uniref:type II toxin-antitoxin system RelE family toxin n=1 Tax=Gloeocapsa sp. PCC 73106 TaxID=102232 RepID=UPI0002ACBFA7|nr:hypothetical protein [Gloeocapsa sp. PCC 73106]ELR96763.1 cytotoxic translational repressor of toxin-antitoxin stability system [Gloeocapsa sp. PCC 73106]
MKTEYFPTFVNDLKLLKGTQVYTKIKNLAFQDIIPSQNLRDIRNVKKLQGQENTYRIGVGDYRIGFFMISDTIIFSRVLHRQEFYRYFP